MHANLIYTTCMYLCFHLYDMYAAFYMHTFLHCSLQAGDSIKEAAAQVPAAQPCVGVQGKWDDIKEAALVVEKKVTAAISAKDIPWFC